MITFELSNVNYTNVLLLINFLKNCLYLGLQRVNFNTTFSLFILSKFRPYFKLLRCLRSIFHMTLRTRLPIRNMWRQILIQRICLMSLWL